MISVPRLAAALVGACASRARIVALIALIATVLAGLYGALTFNIRTDLDALVSPKLDWRRQEARVERLFPSLGDDVTVVIDAPTPEQARFAAERLTQALRPDRDRFAEVARPDGGLFVDRNGLLFLPEAEVREITAKLVRAQPVLGAAAADPSLRGLAQGLSLSLQGVAEDRARLADLTGPAAKVAAVLRAVRDGRPAVLAWSDLLAAEPSTAQDRRRIVRATPRLDFSAVEPGAAAATAVRAAAARLGLTPQAGYRLRLTGTAPMADDELSTLEESTGPIALLSLALMLGVLYAAVRNARLVGAIMLTVLSGLVLTAALGLAVFGRFNLISVAFLPLFVGLGVDFAIQFVVRYRALAARPGEIATRLAQVGRSAGGGLAMAAGATALGFLAFLPTPYRGVSELGLIAGGGMLIAVALTLTLLPALCRLFGIERPAPLSDQAATRPFAGERRPLSVLIAFAVLALAAFAASRTLKVDFDPLALRSPKTESVSTYFDLARHAETSPNTLDVLRPSLAQAAALAERLQALPRVERATTLQAFVPSDQAAKLPLIVEARTLLDPTLDPFDVAPAPDDAARVQALRDLGAALAAVPAPPPALVALGHEVSALAQASPDARLLAERALFAAWPAFLDQVRTSLQAEPVTRDSLPPELVRDWVAPNGTARIEVAPKASPGDPRALRAFVQDVRRIAPQASGTPVTVQAAGQTILQAFIEAACLAALAIVVMLLAVLRSPTPAILTLAPVALTLLLTLATCALIGQAINLENIIALPLLLGIGVSFNIYLVIAWRARSGAEVRASLRHAILFSALTTTTSFSALGLSAHPGTASLGRVLLIALGWTLATTLLFQPALLAVLPPPPERKGPKPPTPT